MKKFKVIEESRFLDKETKQQIKGGVITTLCTTILPYFSPTCPPHETCGSAVVQNFSFCGIERFNYCGEAVQYKITGGFCGPMIRYDALCGPGFVY